MEISWDKKCPVCGGRDVNCQDEFIRYCNGCRFQWNLELTQELLTQLAIAHNKQREQENAADRLAVEEWCTVHEAVATLDRYHGDRCSASVKSGGCRIIVRRPRTGGVVHRRSFVYSDGAPILRCTCGWMTPVADAHEQNSMVQLMKGFYLGRKFERHIEERD